MGGIVGATDDWGSPIGTSNWELILDTLTKSSSKGGSVCCSIADINSWCNWRVGQNESLQDGV